MWSNPDSQWNGFQPVQYVLDSRKVLNLPFARVKAVGGKWIETEETTLASILAEGANRRIRTIETWFQKIAVNIPPDDKEEVVVASVAFNCQLLETLLKFRAREIDAFNATWFWYDSANVLDDPHDSYSFFVVHDNKIVDERVKLFDAHRSGFDPAVLSAGDTSAIWSDEKGWVDAVTRFWYRQFYRETMTGQLMVLRSDEPVLFHYPEADLVRRLFSQPADPGFLERLQAALSALDGKK